MGMICSKAKGRFPIPRDINKNSNTPKVPQLRVPTASDGSELSKQRPASLPQQQPKKKGVMADIAQTAAGVAIGNVVGRKITDMFGDKNNKNDVQSTVDSPTATDYSINNESKNEEITGDDINELEGQGDEEYDNYDAPEDNYDDSE